MITCKCLIEASIELRLEPIKRFVSRLKDTCAVRAVEAASPAIAMDVETSGSICVGSF